LLIVRTQRVQTLTRKVTPSSVKRRLWTFGLNERLVRRLEKLTLCPNVVVFPQTSHFPATAGLPFLAVGREPVVQANGARRLLFRRKWRSGASSFDEHAAATVDEATTTAYPTTPWSERQSSGLAGPRAAQPPVRVLKGPLLGTHRHRHRQHR
jgi:hypothetical protein